MTRGSKSVRYRTPVGTVGSAHRAVVDPAGLVTPWPDGWSLDWWIGAEDRWYFPSEEASVRQRLVGLSPVVETAMRVPGGDAVHRAFAVPGAEELVVVEVENRSPVPFAVAPAVRPYNTDGPAPIKRLALVDRTVTVDGRPAVLFPKPPARMAGATFAEGDVVHAMTTGAAGTSLPPLRCRRGSAEAAFLFPLAHTAVLRMALPMAPKRKGRTTLPASLPSCDAVVRGWDAQAARGMRLELPPGRLADAFEANRRFLLLFPEPVARARSERSGRQALDRLAGLLDTASPTFTWPDNGTAADFVSLVRGLLVRETDAGLALCSALPEQWTGQGIEVHDAPTSFGCLSFAVRWHGERPALLWELQPHANVPGPFTLTAPGLDPSWSTTDLRGDALLTPFPST